MIPLPEKLCDEIRAYENALYDPQLFRQRYHPAASMGLWVRYDLFAIYALEVPADGKGPGLKVDVLRAERQKLDVYKRQNQD